MKPWSGKPRFLSKGERSKTLGISLARRRSGTKPKNVSFLRLYGFGICRLTEPASFANRKEQRGEAVYPQGKTEDGGGEPNTSASVAEQILSLYTKEESKGDYKIFPDTMSKGKLLTHLKAVGWACGIRTPLTWQSEDIASVR